jgi:hypothetical protein
MIFSSRSYAIGMAHHWMAGGMRTMGLLLGGYVLVMGTILGLIFYNVPAGARPDVMRGLFTFLFVVEAFLLVVIGSLRIGGCIRMDLASNMIESHRQMPLHASRAVLGYLFGTMSHIFAVVLLNGVVMAGLAAGADVKFQDFIMSQVVLAFFAMLTWSFAAMGALMFRQALPLLVMGLIFGSIAAMFLRRFGILPGASVLASPFLGETIFNLSGGRFSLRAAYPLAFAAQAGFSAIFFRAACRRYRDAHAVAFSLPLGIALVAAWEALSAVAIRLWPREVHFRFMHELEQPEAPAQIVASLAVTALLMLVPLFSLAAAHRLPPLSRRVLVLGLIVLAGSLAVLGDGARVEPWLITLLVMACHAVTFYALFYLVRERTVVVAGCLVLAALFAIWIAPLIAELVRSEFFAPRWDNPAFTLIGTVSPLGLLITQWSTEENMPGPAAGIVMQVAVAAFFYSLAFRNRQRSKQAEVRGGIAGAHE